jgi:hypothetical protein
MSDSITGNGDIPVHEETDNPTHADDRNFYKVEKWTRDGTKVDGPLYAGNGLDKARDVFAKAIRHRPPINLTIGRERGYSTGGRRDEPRHAKPHI